MPQGRTSLISGGPGSGKTVLGLQFVYNGALAGEPGIFVTFEERTEAVRRNAEAMGWNLERLEQDGTILLLSIALPTDIVRSGRFNIAGLLGILGGQAKARGAKRIVIDAIDVLLRVFQDHEQRVAQISALHDWLQERGVTTVLTTKEPNTGGVPEIDYVVDCVVQLDQRVVRQVTTRRLRIMKYRGSDYLHNEYPFILASGGMALLPIARYGLAPHPVGERISTGVRGLDALIDSGFRRGWCIFVSGASGTGKTALACAFSVAAANRGERVLFISFEESVDCMVQAMLSLGLDLRPAIEAKQMAVLTALPEAMGSEEHLLRIFRPVDTFKPQHVVVDAISACRRMGTDEASFNFLLRLLLYGKERGITLLFLNQTDGGEPTSDVTGFRFASLVDVIIRVEQDWSDESYRRRLLIVKARGSRHSHFYHSFCITDHGLEVEERKS
ncbi:MAG: ATPase domain-containing protein [Candidatus Binatia bacterium]